MANFYPPIEFDIPFAAEKAGDIAERKVLESLNCLDNSLFRLTDTQINALSSLKSATGLLVEGGAGSGKTLLAVRLAHEHLLQGKRVLFTCYYKSLAANLVTDFEGYDNVDVVNYHELVRKRCERSGSRGDGELGFIRQDI